MKFFSLILALLVLTLTAYPCCTDDNCSESASEMYQHSEKQNDIPSADDFCSPFLTCGTCTGFVSEQVQINLQPDFRPVNAYSFFILAPVNHFIAEFWQPPKRS